MPRCLATSLRHSYRSGIRICLQETNGKIGLTLLVVFGTDVTTPANRRAHRRLVSDSMSPAFLNQVAGPQMYTSALDLLQLWTEKSHLVSWPERVRSSCGHGVLLVFPMQSFLKTWASLTSCRQRVARSPLPTTCTEPAWT